MKANARTLPCVVVCFAFALAGCANTLQSFVKSPSVELQSIQVVGLGLDAQTFLLSFAMYNPNSFSLPVRSVTYGVKLDGQSFASGSTAAKFSAPAGGDSGFSISVDLDLLRSAPALLSILSQGARSDIAYQLDGQLAVDIPLTPPLNFSNSGAIRFGRPGQ